VNSPNTTLSVCAVLVDADSFAVGAHTARGADGEGSSGRS
jgi:hypothetical protein